MENATAAIAVAQLLGINAEQIRAALLNFKVFNDGLKEYMPMRESPISMIMRIIPRNWKQQSMPLANCSETKNHRHLSTAPIQPHPDFANGFAVALDQLDCCLLMDIYPAREAPIPGVDARIIFDQMALAEKQLVTKGNLLKSLVALDLEVLLTLGAGDIGTFVQPIKSLLAND